MDRRRRRRFSEAERARVPAWVRVVRQREGDPPVNLSDAEYADFACDPILDDFEDDPPETWGIRSALPDSGVRWLLLDNRRRETRVAARRIYPTRHRTVRASRTGRVRLARAKPAAPTSPGSPGSPPGSDDEPPPAAALLVAHTWRPLRLSGVPAGSSAAANKVAA